MDGSFTNTGFIQLDFIEEGRKNIFEWRDKRRTKRAGLQGRIYEITKLFIDRSIVNSFINNLSIVVGFQMLLAALCTYACMKLKLEFDVQMSLFVSPIVFPLAFSINANYQRRETVLEDLAMFKAASLILFFCHRDWITAVGLSTDLLKTLSNKLKFLVINIREYLLTEDSVKRQFILQAIYEDFSDISQLNDKLRASELKSNSSLIARIIHCHNLMCWSFEKLRVIREYKSPRSLRSFTKVFIFFMPLLLSPYYVHQGHQTKSYWAPYYISALVSFLFGSLQAVQDKLDDPFDGIGEDDVNLGQLDEWTLQSLLINRTVTVGRFTVTTTTAKEEDSGNKSPTRFSQQEEILSMIGSPKKRRRASSRKLSNYTERRPTCLGLSDEEFTNELESRCHGISSKLEGLTGSTTILPGKRTAYFMKMPKSPQATFDTDDGIVTGPDTENVHLKRGEKMGRNKEEKPRSVLPRTSLEVVKESEEEHGVESRKTSPAYQRNIARPDTKQHENGPTVVELFGSETDALTSDESTPGDAEPLKISIFPKPRTPNKRGPTVTQLYADVLKSDADSTTDEGESSSMQKVPKKIEVVKRPTVMELFGLNALDESKTSDSEPKVRKTGVLKRGKTEMLPLLSKKNMSQSPPLTEHESATSLQSPLASGEEDLSEDQDSCDAALTGRPDQLQPRHSSFGTERTHLPKLKFSFGSKRKQWAMPDGLGKWRKRRLKKKPSSLAETDQQGSNSQLQITTSTSALLSNETGSTSHYNQSTELSPNTIPLSESQSTDARTPDSRAIDSKPTNNESSFSDKLRTKSIESTGCDSNESLNSEKQGSRFSVSKSLSNSSANSDEQESEKCRNSENGRGSRFTVSHA